MMKSVEQGIVEIMAILEEGKDKDSVEKKELVEVAGGALSNTAKSTKSAKATNPTATKATPNSGVNVVSETVYDGRGHAISVDGKKTTTGYKKTRRGGTRIADKVKTDLLDTAMAVLKLSPIFSKLLIDLHKTEGVVVRMGDTDYTVKVVGHAKKEFEAELIDPDFKPEIKFTARGNAINHCSGVVKALLNGFENQNPDASFYGIGKSTTLLNATSNNIRFAIENSEYSFKITKKRSRVVL